jgi:hypothetical protein
MAEVQSPHTNSARLPNYLGRTVRLWVKILKVTIAAPSKPCIHRSQTLLQLQGDTAIAQASDGGEVKIKLSAVC